MQKAYIDKISYYLPENCLSNNDLLQLFPDESFKNRLEQLGIKNRHFVQDGMTASDMAVLAAENLFRTHDIDRKEVGFVLFCAQEFDYYTPTTACVIQNRLHLKNNCGALDFNLGCTGFVYGLSIAKGLIESGVADTILLLTASSITRKLHPGDRSSRSLFGDGAAATLIRSGQDSGEIGQFELGTDGASHEKIIIRDGAGRNPLNEASSTAFEDEFGNLSSPKNVYMDGMGIFHFSNKIVPDLVRKTLEKNSISMEAIDLVVFHQANGFLLETLRKKIGIPEEKFFVSLAETGNTVSSTIPIALHEAMQQGKAKKGDAVVLIAFGVGLSWAGTVVRL